MTACGVGYEAMTDNLHQLMNKGTDALMNLSVLKTRKELNILLWDSTQGWFWPNSHKLIL